MFYDAMMVNGTNPTKAKIMFAAVYLAGPRWDTERDISTIPSVTLIQEMQWCAQWIEEVSPTRERIIEWMREREPALVAGTAKKPDFDALRAKGPFVD